MALHPFPCTGISALRLRRRDRQHRIKAESINKSTPKGTAVAIASVLDRLCDDSPDDEDDSLDDEDEPIVGLAAAVLDTDPVEIEEEDDDAIGVLLVPALLVEDEGTRVAELEAELADVVGAGGVAVNSAVAASGSTLLASPLIRSQNRGRPAD